ncbi:MAG: glycosyl hydrolase, partial [Bacteroidia bacterium]|nr:glycosyl hydrolase [Bacteroidia bacterium]
DLHDNKYDALRKEGESLISKMKAWDEDMVQRKSKAYDDVENYPNKFTANYLFVINQTESDIPSVNKPARDRAAELDAEWKTLEARARQLMDMDIPALNKKMWEAGIGAVRVENTGK